MKMPFASDRLYDGYLRRNMATIISKVKVREIVPHLPCLTQSDREEIDAKRETTGNNIAVQLLLDCLRRRQNWPEEFIGALEQCEQDELASEIRAEYESLRGPRAPAAPAVNSHLSPPRHTAPEPLQTPVVADPLPQASPQQEAASDEQSLTPTNMEASAAVLPSRNQAAPSGQDPPVASSHVPPSGSAPTQPDQSQSPETPASAAAVIPPVPQVSPVKTPVQDSNSSVSNGTHQPVENSDPTVNQVATNEAQPAQGGSPAQQPSRTGTSTAEAGHADHWAGSSVAGGAEDGECLSKPGTLRSFRDVPVRRPHSAPALPPVAEEPYSGASDRLELSDSIAGSAAPNEPEEDEYDSVRSLPSSRDVRVNVGHVSEDPPVLNHAGRAPSPSDERPASSPSRGHDPPGPGRSGQRRASPEREQGPVPPYHSLEKYYIPVATIVGLCAVVMLWRLRKN